MEPLAGCPDRDDDHGGEQPGGGIRFLIVSSPEKGELFIGQTTDKLLDVKFNGFLYYGRTYHHQ